MPDFIERPFYTKALDNAFNVHPIVAVLGPRQCGKTTLCRHYLSRLSGSDHRFDLEDPRDLAKLGDPSLALEDLEGLVFIDEIQRKPELFPLLRVLVDREANKTIFLVSGSASRDLIQQSSESLAGRIEYIQLTPLTAAELNFEQQKRHWLRGGFPNSYLAAGDEQSRRWREAFIQTFLERDIPNLGINIPARSLRRFWTILAHYHGQTLNYSELGRALEVTDTTIRRYLDILEGTFMVRLLRPWHTNSKKRQVKSPKVYIRDSGLLHSLLGIDSYEDLLGHPKQGASWEGYCVEEIIRARPVAQPYFWATHRGAELDLLLVRGNRKAGVEIKFSSQPKKTKSMETALAELELTELAVLIPGDENFPLAKTIKAMGIESYLAFSELEDLPSIT